MTGFCSCVSVRHERARTSSSWERLSSQQISPGAEELEGHGPLIRGVQELLIGKNGAGKRGRVPERARSTRNPRRHDVEVRLGGAPVARRGTEGGPAVV